MLARKPKKSRDLISSFRLLRDFDCPLLPLPDRFEAVRPRLLAFEPSNHMNRLSIISVSFFLLFFALKLSIARLMPICAKLEQEL